MPHTKRSNIKPGLYVAIVQKQDQPTGKLTQGFVQDLLTNASIHPRGIKVRLDTGEIGRVQEILEK
ncbi:MAG: YwbE family protein [Patescibacteria group bacterium]